MYLHAIHRVATPPTRPLLLASLHRSICACDSLCTPTSLQPPCSLHLTSTDTSYLQLTQSLRGRPIL
ncbi:hypothetical protein BC567DRAFT_221895 [Phyllosticta citribraziliensis]